MKTAAIVLLLCIFAGAQNQPRHFWGRRNIAITVAHAALAGADAGRTCYNLANGGRERWMPTQSCAAVTSFIVGGVAVNLTARWLFDRRGHIAASDITGAAGIAGSAYSFIYSSTH